MKLDEVLKNKGWTLSKDFVDLSHGAERPWYVYRHTCTVNGKCYIGISDNPIKRWKEHVYASRSKYNADYSAKFKRAIRKHGVDAWAKEILLVVTDIEQAKWFETVRIRHADSYRNGYNSTWGGDGTKRGETLTEEFILARVREYREANGKWPTADSGPVEGGYLGDTWRGYESALFQGCRGLPGGSSLAQLMENADIGYINEKNKPDLTKEFILDRANEYYIQNNRWPDPKCGDVKGGYPGDTWSGYESSLVAGCRGLVGGSSLAKIMHESNLSYTNRFMKNDLNIEFIVDRAKEFYHKHGKFPSHTSGVVEGGHQGDTWSTYEQSLRNGKRGLVRGSSLSQLMHDARIGYSNNKNRPRLSNDFILDRVKSHVSRTGQFPVVKSGVVNGGHKGDTWQCYDALLREGGRGLVGGSSLAKLMESSDIGYTNPFNKPKISAEFVIDRAVEFKLKHGRWPAQYSGVVENGNPGDTWCSYDKALANGNRGLPGGSSLAKLIATVKDKK